MVRQVGASRLRILPLAFDMPRGPDIEDPPASDGRVVAHPQAPCTRHGRPWRSPARQGAGPRVAQARPAAPARSPPPQAPPGSAAARSPGWPCRCRCARCGRRRPARQTVSDGGPARRDQRAGHGDVQGSPLPRPRHRRPRGWSWLERDLGGARSRVRHGSPPRRPPACSRSWPSTTIGAIAVPSAPCRLPERRRPTRPRCAPSSRPIRRSADHAVERGQPRRRADRRPARSRGRLLQRRAPGLRRLHARGGRRHRRPGHAVVAGRVPARARRGAEGMGAARLLRHDLLPHHGPRGLHARGQRARSGSPRRAASSSCAPATAPSRSPATSCAPVRR